MIRDISGDHTPSVSMLSPKVNRVVVLRARSVTVDLRTLKSDQELRDNYLRTRTFETDKFPLAVFVPKKLSGVSFPMPGSIQAQSAFQLVGDMTIHGVTKEMTWNGVATYMADTVAGLATTSVNVTTFDMLKPTLARIMSIDDTIELQASLRFKRTNSPVQ